MNSRAAHLGNEVEASSWVPNEALFQKSKHIADKKQQQQKLMTYLLKS